VTAAGEYAIRDVAPAFVAQLVAQHEWAPADVDAGEMWVDAVLARAADGDLPKRSIGTARTARSVISVMLMRVVPCPRGRAGVAARRRGIVERMIR
jgi:hypothetical protein